MCTLNFLFSKFTQHNKKLLIKKLIRYFSDIYCNFRLSSTNIKYRSMCHLIGDESEFGVKS